MMAEDCKPIVVTDAGFRTPWFKEIESLGWDWVGRTDTQQTHDKKLQ